MKLKISKEACIGCGACVATVGEEIIDFNDEGFAEPVKEEYSDELKDALEGVCEVCPTEAISTEE